MTYFVVDETGFAGSSSSSVLVLVEFSDFGDASVLLSSSFASVVVVELDLDSLSVFAGAASVSVEVVSVPLPYVLLSLSEVILF